MLEKYRPTMTDDVAHSWAQDAQIKIDKLTVVLEELNTCISPVYSMSPEGREYLEKVRNALDT